jgi:hypothetical protein
MPLHAIAGVSFAAAAKALASTIRRRVLAPADCSVDAGTWWRDGMELANASIAASGVLSPR